MRGGRLLGARGEERAGCSAGASASALQPAHGVTPALGAPAALTKLRWRFTGHTSAMRATRTWVVAVQGVIVGYLHCFDSIVHSCLGIAFLIIEPAWRLFVSWCAAEGVEEEESSGARSKLACLLLASGSSNAATPGMAARSLVQRAT